VLTPRLEVRPPVEADRDRFTQLWCDPEFMVFSDGVLDVEAANRRFDRMLERASELYFAKQPVIERASGAIIGYAGVDRVDFEGLSRLEFGYRLIPEARGRGYGTEAGSALLTTATEGFRGEILAIIDPTNLPSQRVAIKLGFVVWRQALVDGRLYDVHRLWLDS
jgi:RimJ/RimL family protein N-acetyltransferase